MATIKSDGRYAMLLRKSREDVEAEARGQMETLALHEEALRRLASNLGIEVSKVYRELVSGDRLDERPETMQLVHEVMRGEWDGVLAYDIQRISRGDMIDQGVIMNAFKYSRTLIVTPGKVFDLADDYDSNAVEMNLMMGRVELGWIKKRLVEGKENRSRRGEYLGSIAPFGWEKCTIDHMKTLRPGEHHERLYQMYADIAAWARTPKGMADDLNRQGFPTPRGKHWDAKTITSIIRNPVNIGYVRWNQRKTRVQFDEDMNRRKVRGVPKDDERILAEGLHRGAGLITDELFDAANRQLDAHGGTSEHTGKPLRNPLAGVLVCKGCGRAMARSIFPGERKGGGARGKTEWYTHPQSNRYECHMQGAVMRDVVNLAVDALLFVARDIEVAIDADDGQRAEAARKVAESLRRSLADEDAALENLFRLVERGIITDAEFASRKALADGRRASLEAQLAQAEAEAADDHGEALARVVALREAVDSLRHYEGRVKEVNDLVKSIVQRIEYEKDPQTGEIRLGVFLR